MLGTVFQGGNVTQAVGSGLIDGVALTPAAVILALLTAAGLMTVGVFTGFPIATAFTVTGAIVGSGLALGGVPAWSKCAEVGVMWTVAPLVNAALAYGLASLLPREDVPEERVVPVFAGVTGAVVAVVRFSFLAPPGHSESVAGAVDEAVGPTAVRPDLVVVLGIGALSAVVVARWIHSAEERGLKRFLVALGSLVAFSAGGSQVGLAVGPLVSLLTEVNVPLMAVLSGGGLGILVGSWTGAPRMIQSLSQDYASLGPRRSVSTLLPTFLFAQVAVALGTPTSFNQAIVTAIVGSGAAVGGDDGVGAGKLLRTVGAWAGSFVLAFALGVGTLTAL